MGCDIWGKWVSERKEHTSHPSAAAPAASAASTSVHGSAAPTLGSKSALRIGVDVDGKKTAKCDKWATSGGSESVWMIEKNGKVRQVGEKWGNTVGHELGSKCDEWRESIWVGVY